MKILALTLTLLAGPSWARNNSDIAVDFLVAGRCEAALEPLNAGIKAGEAKAYFLVGFMYHKGYCLGVDPLRAIPLLEIAARHGEGDAAEQLVLIHGLGRGVAQSFTQAGRWAVAASDIRRLKAAARSASDPADSASDPADSPRAPFEGGLLDAGETQAYGKAATIHARARELFELDWRSRFPSEMSFSLLATTTPSSGVDVEVVDTGLGSTVRGMERRRLIDAQLSRLKEAYAIAVADVSRLSTNPTPRTRREYTIQIR